MMLFRWARLCCGGALLGFFLLWGVPGGWGELPVGAVSDNVPPSEQVDLAAPIPQRIISLGPINTENVYLLGADDRLVGDTSYCNRPPAAAHKEKIGSVMQISVEKIIGLHPDLVLATSLSPKLQLAMLEESGLRVVRFGHARSFTEICEYFQRLGTLLGLEDRARKLLGTVHSRVDAVRSAVAGKPQPRVFLQVGTDPLKASVGNSFTADFISLAGGVSITDDQKLPRVELEKVLAKDPEVIIIAIMGSETGLAGKERRRWMHFQQIRAVRDRRVHIIDPDLICSPSPSTFADALEQIAVLIHPELVGPDGSAGGAALPAAAPGRSEIPKITPQTTAR